MPKSDDMMEAPVDDFSSASEYRSLSGAAVAAFVLGLLSAAALAYPVMLVIPAAGIGAAFVALSSIRKSEGSLAGTLLARVGLALSLAMMVATLVRDPVRNRFFISQADATASQWTRLLADGKFDDAAGLISSSGTRLLLPAQEPGTKAPPPEETAATLREALAKHPLTLLVAGKGPALKLIPLTAGSAPEMEGSVAGVTRDYRIEGLAGDEQYVQIFMRRILGIPTASSVWRVERFQVGPKPLPAPPAP